MRSWLTCCPLPQKAAEDAAPILGGKLDYLIANAGYVSMFDAFHGIGTLCVFLSPPPVDVDVGDPFILPY